MAKRVKRVKSSARVKVTGMEIRLKAELEVTHGRGEGEKPISHRFLDLDADPTLEVRFELPAEWDGAFPLEGAALKGARVKPVVFVPEELSAEVDRHALRSAILETGAVYCKVPIVQVARKKVKRDERYAVELPLEESLRIFAEETRAEDAERLVKFAAALAREADAAGEKEDCS